MSNAMVHAVNVVITNPEGKYLLQMRDGSEGIRNPLTWGFFGGGMETGESPIVAAIREVKEELGIEIDESLMTVKGSGQVREDKVVYTVEMKKQLAWGDFIIHEGAGAAFFTREELHRINLSQTAQVVVQQLL